MTEPGDGSKPGPLQTELRRAFLGKQPLVYLVTAEEQRAAHAVELAATGILPKGFAVHNWSAALGLAGADSSATKDPKIALEQARTGCGPAIYLFRDLHSFLDQPGVVRGLREFYATSNGDRVIVILAPIYALPIELRKETAVIDMPPTTIADLAPAIDVVLAATVKQPGADFKSRRHQVLRALQGLTINEAQHVAQRILSEQALDDRAIRAIQEEKARLIRKEGVLEFVPHDVSLEDVGGLENLKDWLRKRRELFFAEDPEAVAELIPRGLLMMGVSGCGKSLSVKAVSQFWDLPLFRLDMNAIFAGTSGSAEDSFRRALTAAEAFAPCVLWIDEIEGGITGYGSQHGGATWRIFSTFLTWMQEKTAAVFVAATANRIDLLPAEILRKGRFDQIFFVDLPSDTERSDIFRVHLTMRGNDLSKFDSTILARGTKGWNGAEIEQCIVAAMIEAYAAGRPLEKDDVYAQLSNIVPLSTTMSEQIKAIRSWAHDRALKAGR